MKVEQPLDLSPYFASWLRSLYRAELITPEQIEQWSTRVIQQLNPPPTWVTDVAMYSDPDEVYGKLTGYAVPLEFGESDVFVACQFLRFNRGDIPWIRFLIDSGDTCDASPGIKDCEYFYALANEFDAGRKSDKLRSLQSTEITSAYADVLSLVETRYTHFCSQCQ